MSNQSTLFQPHEFTFFAVAWVDILGWKAIGQENPEAKARLWKAIQEAPGPGGIYIPSARSILRSGMPVAETNPENIDGVIIRHGLLAGEWAGHDVFWHSLWFACWKILSYGFLFRGCVTSGMGEDIVPTLNRAMRIESNTPQPMIVMDARRDGKRFAPYYPLTAAEERLLCRRRRAERVIIFDFLKYLDRPCDAEEIVPLQRCQLEEYRPIIEENLSKYFWGNNNRRVANKHLWFARYFNEVAAELEVAPIDLAGCDSQ